MDSLNGCRISLRFDVDRQRIETHLAAHKLNVNMSRGSSCAMFLVTLHLHSSAGTACVMAQNSS